MHDEDRGVDLVGVEYGGVFDVEVEPALFPERFADAALSVFVLAGASVS